MASGQTILAGGSRIEEAAAAPGAPREHEFVSYTAMGERTRRPVSRHQVLLALCSTAVVVCAVGGLMRSRGEDAAPGVLSQKLLFGAGVGGDDVANSILDNARKKYEASKQRLLAKQLLLRHHRLLLFLSRLLLLRSRLLPPPPSRRQRRQSLASRRRRRRSRRRLPSTRSRRGTS